MDLLAQTPGSSLSGLLLPGALLVGMYFLLIRPQRARQRAQERLLGELAPGDEVMTAGGLFGKVARLDETRIGLLVAPGVEIEVLRVAVRERLRAVDTPVDPEP